MSTAKPHVAVIDLGSNSIKMLVATTGSPLFTVHQAARPVRIGSGMSAAVPYITKDACDAAAQAINELLAEARPHQPQLIRILATSAMRDAQNAPEALASLERHCHHTPEILSGEEEARLIGLGVTTDPTLRDLGGSFSMVDIGGGSVEYIDLKKNEVQQLASLPLGAIRQTERYVAHPLDGVTEPELEALYQATTDAIEASTLDLFNANRPLIGTGGAIVTTRAILGAQNGKTLAQSSPILSIRHIGELLAEIAGMTYTERLHIPGLPERRADIFPAALATLLAIADSADTPTVIHSFHSLSYGAALEMLQALKEQG